MNYKTITLLLFSLFVMPLISIADDVTAPKPGTYKIDIEHTLVSFSVRHLGISKISGRFNKFDGTISFNKEGLKSLVTKGSIDISSINTDNQKRDKHLKSPDFLDETKFPKITFSSTQINNISQNNFELSGTLSIHGISKKIKIVCIYNGYVVDPWGNERIALEASTTINRKNFGLVWNKFLDTGILVVGNSVKIKLEIEAIRNKDVKK